MEFTNTTKVLQEFADQLISQYQENLMATTPYPTHTTGALADVQFGPEDITAKGGNIEVTIHLADYWKYVENGRAPGKRMPPLDAIEKWVEYHNLLPAESYQGISDYAAVVPNLSKLGSASESYSPITWAVAKSIAEDGIPAKHVLKDAIDATWSRFKDMIVEALSKDVGTELKAVVSEIWSGYGQVDGQWQSITDTITL